MHLSVEEKCQRLSSELEEEKRKHQEYMVKSDDFVNLIGKHEVELHFQTNALKMLLIKKLNVFFRKRSVQDRLQ